MRLGGVGGWSRTFGILFSQVILVCIIVSSLSMAASRPLSNPASDINLALEAMDKVAVGFSKTNYKQGNMYSGRFCSLTELSQQKRVVIVRYLAQSHFLLIMIRGMMNAQLC